MLAHCQEGRVPLPGAVLTRGETTIAIIAKPRELDHRALEQQVVPLLDLYAHTLLVFPTVGRNTRRWIEEQRWSVMAVGYQRNPRVVSLDRLPVLPELAERLYDRSWTDHDDGEW